MPSDLEQPTHPSDYRSGFFGADYRNDSAAVFTNWISPGNRFFRVQSGVNADASSATDAQITTARNQWEGFTQCIRWRIRLHHTAGIRKQHETIAKLFVYYTTDIPVAKKAQIRNCLIPGEFEFLGDTFAEAKATLNAAQAGLANKFWVAVPPHFAAGQVDHIIAGWGADFGL
jgi:hypothetical protein